MTKTHIALITSWNQKGGIADYSERFVNALRDTESEVTVIPIKNPNTANPSLFNDIFNTIPESVDIIHVQYEAGLFGRLGMSGICAPSFFLRAASIPTPVVTTLHEVHQSHSHQNVFADYLLRSRDLVIERFALWVSDRIVVHTETAKNILTDRHDRNNHIVQMHHPVEVDAVAMDQQVARSELGFEGPLLLTFGWIEEKKNYEQVVDVLPKIPTVQYLIAGSPRNENDSAVLKRTLNRAEKLGVAERVHHLGYVSDSAVQTLFNAVDIVVLPYERVSQSGTLNLALGYERPVLATALDPFEELRDEFGCPATYEDTDELKRKLTNLLHNNQERENLSEHAAAYADKLTWNRFAENSQAIYCRVLDAV